MFNQNKLIFLIQKTKTVTILLNGDKALKYNKSTIFQFEFFITIYNNRSYNHNCP